MTDKLIMDYVEQERERCAQLCEAIEDSKFLAYCIRTPVMPNEIEHWRKRFDELSTTDDDIEDLM